MIDITKDLNSKPYKDSSLNNINGITWNFDNHISIKRIKESFPNIVSSDFNFEEVSKEDVQKEIINLNAKNPQLMGQFHWQF